MAEAGTVPADTAAAFHAPPETATQTAGAIASSVSASITPTWKAHRDAPPESTSPTRRAERSSARAGDGSEGSFISASKLAARPKISRPRAPHPAASSWIGTGMKQRTKRSSATTARARRLPSSGRLSSETGGWKRPITSTTTHQSSQPGQ